MIWNSSDKFTIDACLRKDCGRKRLEQRTHQFLVDFHSHRSLQQRYRHH